MLVITLAAVYWAPAPIAERLIRDDIHAQAELWKKQVILQMDDAENSFTTSSVTAHDQRFLRLLVEATDVYRFHLFDSSGKIFWSTDGAQIGTMAESDYFHQLVAKGLVYYKTEDKPAWEVTAAQHIKVQQQAATDDSYGHDHTHDQGHSHENLTSVSQSYLTGDAADAMRQVAEIYVPFMHNGHFDGAIEFYTDITETRANILNRVRLLLAGIAGAVVMTMITAGMLLHRNNARHVTQLNRRNDKERDIIDQQLRLAREVQLLGELNEWLQSSHSLEELFEMVARFMTHILPNAEGSVYVYSNSRDVLDGSAKWNGGTVKPHIHPEECWGLRRGRTYEYGASEVDFVCDHAEPHDGRPYYCFPILAHGETVGLMHLRAAAGHEANFRQNKKLARMCAEQISMAIANVRMRDQLQDQSVRDPLTGLFNRRHMTETLRKAIGNSQSTGAPLSLIAVDVDHFKKFNDNHGHDAGDMILRAVGSALEKACDGDQIACRPGGEEFTLILPGVYDADALIKAEALRQAVEAISLRYGDKTLPTVTISLGVSHYPQHGSMPQDLMRSADEALYEAKAHGRNQVQQAMGAAPQPRDASVANTSTDASAPAIEDTPIDVKNWDQDRASDRTDPDAKKGDDKPSPPAVAAQ
ncbi:diguanylate cyclase [Thalassobius sp. Cn5-15]|uniref:sensor domain-containing diguanylate cyclase n=1 Tax=Thalassobius sp. Cn5-15 TaxID=2917763 RepID=UPI00351D805B